MLSSWPSPPELPDLSLTMLRCQSLPHSLTAVTNNTETESGEVRFRDRMMWLREAGCYRAQRKPMAERGDPATR